MKSLKDTYTLHNDVRIPIVGFGTWQTPDGEVAIESVLAAIAAGYRHIDTAAGYGNEASVGIAVKKNGIPREEIFITSKLQNTAHEYEATMEAFEDTMAKLDLSYLDLYLIHWPNPLKYRDRWKEANAGSWRAMEKLYKADKIRAIGISNFRPHHIDALLETAEIVPMVNQIRLCPGDTQDETVSYCRERNILLEAYSPLGTGLIFDSPEVKELAEKYGKSIAQICLRWSLQRGYLPLPKSVTPNRIVENGELFDFELSLDDVEKLAVLVNACGIGKDPDTIQF